VFEDGFYIFGGYDGQSRVNDFFGFSFPKKAWFVVPASGKPPTPRDRHTAVVHDKSFYVFAGFDGTNRVNDFHAFDFKSNQWKTIASNQPPSARHSHACVIYGHSMFCFGGSVLLFHSRMDLLLIFIVVVAGTMAVTGTTFTNSCSRRTPGRYERPRRCCRSTATST
jgi:hypothetical protein